MASRFRSLAKATFSIPKSTINKSNLKPKPASSLLPACSSPTFSRCVSQLGCLQSLLPLHSAVSSARLTSCLGIDSRSSRSLSHDCFISDHGVHVQSTLIGSVQTMTRPEFESFHMVREDCA